MKWNKVLRRRLTPDEVPRDQAIWVACNNGKVYLTRWDSGIIAAFHFDGSIRPEYWTEAVPPEHPGPRCKENHQ